MGGWPQSRTARILNTEPEQSGHECLVNSIFYNVAEQGNESPRRVMGYGDGKHHEHSSSRDARTAVKLQRELLVSADECQQSMDLPLQCPAFFHGLSQQRLLSLML